MRTTIALDRQEDVAVLTFDCDEPGKPTTVDLDVLNELERALETVRGAAGELCALVVRSSTPRYFLVGADVRALETLGAETILPWIQRGHHVFDQLERLPLPTIARVEGYALGGGLELAMACDLIVASARARLGQPEAKLGFVAGWGGTYRLPRRVGAARAKELFFTGRVVEADEALALGLVDRVCEPDALDSCLDGLLDQFRTCSAVALAEMKRLVNEAHAPGLQHSHLQELVSSARCIADPGTKDRLRAFLDRRT
jgi:enoyl-CoA hydratase